MSIEILGKKIDRQEEILSESALELISKLHTKLNPRRIELLAMRKERIAAIAGGKELSFLEETKAIRDDLSWKVAPLAPGLIDRREIS